jgi:hypothetical protein
MYLWLLTFRIGGILEIIRIVLEQPWIFVLFWIQGLYIAQPGLKFLGARGPAISLLSAGTPCGMPPVLAWNYFFEFLHSTNTYCALAVLALGTQW